MDEKERELSLLRFENSPDGRETRLLLFNVRRIGNGNENEMRGRSMERSVSREVK